MSGGFSRSVTPLPQRLPTSEQSSGLNSSGSYPGNDNLVKRKSRLGAIPLNEFVDGVSVARFDSGERRLSSSADLL